MDRKKRPLIVAFATQKGGVGKTTFSVLASSYMHYKLGYNVALVDCDYPQHSIEKMRKRDLKQIETNDAYRIMAYEQFTQLGKKAYPILLASAETAIQVIDEHIASSIVPSDVIFIDIPGTVNTNGVLSTLAQADYIFTPIVSDRLILESGLSFAIGVNEHFVLNPEYNLKGLYLFWNRVDKREKTDLYSVYEKTINEFGLPLLKTYLPESKKYKKEIAEAGKPVFRSTMFPIHQRMIKDSNFLELLEEIIKIINL